ncbi:ligand-binding sensor domain-containing protein [Shivajiella indica]|uniref:Two-component regulator propeller domain-containing protein n=1 Tax=Shivajiella indica TaxID=872115 RepID=A0ABW5B7X0_9BACT
MRSIITFSLFFLLVFLSKANPNRFFNRITVDDGLASNNVYTVWQDKRGYMWVGSSNGLQRFDGKYFLSFTIENPVKLPAQPVRQILEDTQGQMWIRYGDHYGIYNPSNMSFQEVPFEKSEVRYHGEKLWMDSKGNIFVLLRRNKLLVYDPIKKNFTDHNVPVSLPDGYQPNTIFEDKKTGFYWVGCQQGMAVYDPREKKSYSKGNNPLHLPNLDHEDVKIVFDYHIDSKRVHWMVYWNPNQKFLAFDENSGKYLKNLGALTFNPEGEYREVIGFFETRSYDRFYYGVNYLFQNIEGNPYFDFIRNEFMPFSQIYHMFEDKEGGIWLASDEGIYHYSNYSPDILYRFFREKEPKHLFLSIAEIKMRDSSNREYWIASWGKGLFFLDQDLYEIKSPSYSAALPESKEYRQPWCILQERNSGLVWVGAQMGVLQVIDPETKKMGNYKFPIFRNSTIRSISQDEEGNIWFTTQRGDLIRYNAGKPLENESFELVREFNGFSFAHLVDKNDRVWVCTSDNGVYILDRKSGETIRHLDDKILSSNKQEKITQLNDSIFFFGYDLLNAYNANTGENRILSYSEGMISNDILHMQADQDGFLWIYTPIGICRYNYFQNSFTHYGKKDGFGLIERDGHGGLLTSDNRMIFTGYSSLFSFNPSQFNSSIKPDRPTLTNIKLFDHFLFVDSLNTDKKRTFSYDQNAFTFFFSTLNYTNQDKLKYFHRLSDIDTEWQLSGFTNMAVYSLLPPGKYSLEFRSENEEGVSSPIGSFYFRILPPFYETWWFRILIGLSLVFILGVMYRLHINRILAVVKVRNRVARDLHDDMGSTLSTINILSTMAKTKLNSDPVKTSQYISKISDNSQRMMEAMDDIVWNIKPQNDSMEKVIARMREFSTNAMDARDIDFRFEVEENVYGVKLPMDTRRDLFLIFKEAINNLVKYSKSSRAFIHFSIKKKHLHMRVRDYGAGFDLAKADNGNGLSNMQKRSENMGATLKITSEKGEGTEVILDIRI